MIVEKGRWRVEPQCLFDDATQVSQLLDVLVIDVATRIAKNKVYFFVKFDLFV